ncbi:MAG: hypothetical protein MJB14_00725 [Spirochaetes bacterium]|nr:hypothetical protein [Spirochaetota bacterium]
MNKRPKYILTILFLLIIGISGFSSHFDQINWRLEKEKSNIRLLVAGNHYYRAETIVSDITPEQIIDLILDYQKYQKVFPKTTVFQPVAQSSTGNDIIYVVINFFPFKNRDYYIELTTYQKGDTYYIEWYPPLEIVRDQKLKNSQFHHVTKIFGRWTIQKKGLDKLFLALEFDNDWHIDVAPRIVDKIAQQETINTLKDLIKYLDNP